MYNCYYNPAYPQGIPYPHLTDDFSTLDVEFTIKITNDVPGNHMAIVGLQVLNPEAPGELIDPDIKFLPNTGDTVKFTFTDKDITTRSLMIGGPIIGHFYTEGVRFCVLPRIQEGDYTISQILNNDRILCVIPI